MVPLVGRCETNVTGTDIGPSAARDPIALLEQVLGHVAGLRRDFGEMQRDVGELNARLDSVRNELKEEITAVRREVTSLCGDFVRVASGLEREQAAFKAEVEQVIDRKWLVTEHRMRDQVDRLEQRVAELEAKERRRLTGENA